MTVVRDGAAVDAVEPEAGHGIGWGEALRTWIKVGLLSFGGPAGQIAVMHRILVEEKRWIGEARFLHVLNYCMLLPGPEAMQLATYVGWLFHKTRGGLVAGALFVLPGFVSILGLSLIYAGLGRLALVQALFFGLKAAVLAVVVEAVLRIGRRALKNRVMVGLSAAAFVGIFLFDVPFPLIVLAAALIGLVGGRLRPDWFPVPSHKATEGADDALLDQVPEHTRPSLGGALRVSAVWLTLWLLPVVALGLLRGWDDVFATEAVFFSKMAVVTFGGAYAVLAYVAQEAVGHFG
jgi:chromate transporter